MLVGKIWTDVTYIFVTPRSQEHTGQAIIAKIVQRCRLGQPLLLWCIAYAATSQWIAVDPRLRLWLRRVFSGWLQTRVNEKANKVWRDTQRDNASKVSGAGPQGV